LIHRGTQVEILGAIERSTPGVTSALRVAREAAPGPKGSILDCQAAALCALAREYPTGRFLEIGTLRGFSAAVLAQAAPKATIITLNPSPIEAVVARRNLSSFPNVSVICRLSWDHMALDVGDYDLIFVDGDHNAIARDLPWFNRLRVGGLMLFHDYTPLGSPSASPIVYAALNEMSARLHGFDVLVVDDQGIGLAGVYRREGETW
jgi:predicted O-methyltransferase YrrM